MKKEAFQEIAKHFAETIKVSLRFEEGAVPSTNGKEIVLPTEMSEAYLDETLGALLHETNHIRYTDMDYFQSLDRLTKEVTNVVEDIRVDSLALKKYPNSKCFYIKLVNDVINNRLDKLHGEQLPFKVLKGLILHNFGVDINKVYGTCADWVDMKKHLLKLIPLLVEVKMAFKVQDLKDVVATIIKELFGTPPKQKANAKAPDENCNDDSGGMEDPTNADNDPRSGDNPDEQKKDPLEQVADIIDDFQKSEKKSSEAKEKTARAELESRQHSEAYNKAARSKKCYNTKTRKLQREAGWNQPLNAEQQKKKERYEQVIKDRTTTMVKENPEWDKANTEERTARNQAATIKDKLEKLKDELDKAFGEMFSTTEHSQLLGFNALDKDKLKDKNYIDVPYSITLDELIKEVLIIKQEEYQQEETGKLNMRRLHEVFTEPDNMFVEKEHRDIQTRVSFIVDVSGSMDSYGACEEDKRNMLALHALNIVASSFQKAIKQGAPGEMKIYAFGDDIYEAVPNAESFKPVEEYELKNWTSKAGGSTNLSKCVNLIVNEVNNDTEFRNTLIIITDAEVDEQELQTMTNNISTADVRVLYIAVGSNLRTKEAQELFGENNITNRDNALKILQDVMFQGMYQLV